jgi:hypothetical protein
MPARIGERLRSRVEGPAARRHPLLSRASRSHENEETSLTRGVDAPLEDPDPARGGGTRRLQNPDPASGSPMGNGSTPTGRAR